MRQTLLALLSSTALATSAWAASAPCGSGGLPACPTPYIAGQTFQPPGVTVTAGTASPAASAPVGSLYIGTTGLWQYISGSWLKFATGALGVTSVTCGTGLNGGTITSSGTCSLANPGTSTIGGVVANAGTSGQFVTGINTANGQLTFGTPPGATYTGAAPITVDGTSHVIAVTNETVDALTGAGTLSGTDQALVRQSGTSTLLASLSAVASYVSGTIGSVVNSIGGLTGTIACGTNIVCSGGTISASGGLAGLTDGTSVISSGTATLAGAHIVGNTAISGGLTNISSGVPSLSAFTQLTGSGITASYAQSTGGTIVGTYDGSNGLLTIAGISIPVPSSAPYRVAVLGIGTYFPTVYCWDFEWGFTDGTKLDLVDVCVNTSNFYSEHTNWSNISSRSSVANITGGVYGAANSIWLAVRDDGTNVYFEYSPPDDGVNFITLYSTAKSSGYLGSGGYTNVFLGVLPYAAGRSYFTIRAYNPNALTASFP